MDCKPTEIVGLKDGNILVGSWRDKCLSLYSRDFNLIQKMHQISGYKYSTIAPRALACCDYGNIFINAENFTIVKLSPNLEFSKSTQQSDDRFYTDICIYENKIYACVLDLKRVDVLSLDLEIISSHYLEHEPNRIRISNATACVLVKTNGKLQKTCFYRLPSFELVRMYDKCHLILSHNHQFFTLDNDFLKSFNENGRLVDQKHTNYGYANGISIIGDKMFICLHGKKVRMIRIC